MKVILMLVMFFFVVGCGKRYSADEMVGDILAKQEEVISVIGGVKDVDSAKRAAERIDGIGDDLVVIAERKMEVPEDDERVALRERVKEATVTMRVRFGESVKGISQHPQAAGILVEAMERFEVKAAKAEAILKF